MFKGIIPLNLIQEWLKKIKHANELTERHENLIITFFIYIYAKTHKESSFIKSNFKVIFSNFVESNFKLIS